MWADLVGLIGLFDLLSRRIFQLDLLSFYTVSVLLGMTYSVGFLDVAQRFIG